MSLYFIIVGTFSLGVWIFILSISITNIISNRITKEQRKS